MRFALTTEQTDFRSGLDALLGDADTVGAARAWAKDDPGPGLTQWKQLAEVGVGALVVSETDGGLGASYVDLVVAHEALGHHLSVGPWIESSAYLATALDRQPGAARIAEGAIATAPAPGSAFALDADVADLVLSPGPGGFVPAVAGSRQDSFDTTRRLFELDPPPASVEHGRAFDVAALACAAQLVGAGERVLADAIAYAKEREQFGRPIGSFQAIKHQLADVRIALDFTRPLIHGAALALDGDAPETGRAVSAAKAYSNDAAALAARVGLQVHGAVGYTQELPLSLWLLRIRALTSTWGTSTFHRRRVLASLTGGRGDA